MNAKNTIRIRRRIALLLAICVSTALFFSIAGLFDRYRATRHMESICTLSEFAVELGGLVHDLQQERGASALYLGSGGDRFAKELATQRERTDRQLSILEPQVLSTSIFQFEQGLQQLKQLPALRRRIDAMEIPNAESMEYYTQIIRIFVDALTVAEHDLDENDSLTHRLAYTYFLQSKEYAGQERATLSIVFATDHFPSAQKTRYIAQIVEHRIAIQSFLLFANAKQKTLYQDTLDHPAVVEAERLRAKALAQNENFSIDPTYWFAQQTQKMDLLRKVEVQLANDLLVWASARKREAQWSLAFLLLVAGTALMTAGWLVITLIKKINAPLGERENFTRMLIDNALDAVVVIDQYGSVIDWNERATSIFGWNRQEAMGREVSELIIPEEHRAAHLQGMRNFLDNGRGPILNTRVQISALHRSGNDFPVELTVSPLHYEGQIICCAFIRDMTEARRMEKALHQAQRMEAIGQLAGGIAHDFNNLLTVINGFSELALLQTDPATRLGQNMLQVKQAGDQAATLTSKLLAFSRQQKLKIEVLYLNQTVGNMQKMLRRLIGENIDLQLDLAADLHTVESDASQMEQVVLNLAVNARDAMPEGGLLKVKTNNVHLDREACRDWADAEPGDYVRLSVIDTGTGMDEKTRLSIFEPFFTTKDKDRGTGLGLATVHGIVKQSEGHITVESQMGTGTTFHIHLPRCTSEQTEDPGPLNHPELNGGPEMVLVVEDDKQVGDYVRHALETGGYTVILSASPVEALDLYGQHADEIDLLLSDIIMPGMNGPRMIEHMHTERHRCKVLYMSGYPGDITSQHLTPDTPLLHKPFTSKELMQKVRAAIDH